MATILRQTGAGVFQNATRTFFHRNMDQLRTAMARRKVYRETFCELSRLSDRDLNDLGIARSNIKKLALEAAYGC